jgi:hypothetical protein
MKKTGGTQRLVGLGDLKISHEQALHALDSKDGLAAVGRDTGLSDREIGDEVGKFVNMISGAWKTVRVPRIDSTTSVMCW